MVVESFVEIAHRIVWCTVATVDRLGRPRSRVLHPYWEATEDGLLGWITTRPTPLKVAHLDRTPFVSCSYWDIKHDTAAAECQARWERDPDETQRVWDLFRAAPVPLGHDPAKIWPDGPSSDDAGLLRLEPWRISVRTLEDLLNGTRGEVWRPTG
jgi:hypothetical protein